MLVLAMQFSKGNEPHDLMSWAGAQQSPRQDKPGRGLEGRSFRAEQRTERSVDAWRREGDEPTTVAEHQLTQLANASTGNPLPNGRMLDSLERR